MKAQLAWSVCIALALGRAQCAVVFPKAPEGGRNAVRTYTIGVLRYDPQFMRKFSFADLTVGQPFRNYYAGRTNIATGQLLSGARPGDWTYLLLHGTNAVGGATVKSDKGIGPVCTGLFQSNFASETLIAFDIAKKLPQTRNHDYEMRRLDVPTMHFVALWLHAPSDDILIPLSSMFNEVKLYEIYPEKDVTKILQAAAK